MPTMHLTRRKLFTAVAAFLALAALAWVLVGNRPAQADYTLTESVSATKDAWSKFHYQEANKCTLCHDLPKPATEASWDLCTFAEWPIWKTHDKHAQAYAVLRGERGRKMARLLYPDMKEEDAAKQVLEAKGG